MAEKVGPFEYVGWGVGILTNHPHPQPYLALAKKKCQFSRWYEFRYIWEMNPVVSRSHAYTHLYASEHVKYSLKYLDTLSYP